MDSITVFDSPDRILIAMAKGLLQDAGIPFYVSGEEIGLRPGMTDPFLHRPYSIQIPRSFENRAREILDRLESSPPA